MKNMKSLKLYYLVFYLDLELFIDATQFLVYSLRKANYPVHAAFKISNICNINHIIILK